MKEILEILAPVLGEELAKDVIAHRKGLKCPLTARGAKALLKQYEMTGNAVEAAEEHLNRGWQGFKAEWMQKGKSFRDERNPMPLKTSANYGPAEIVSPPEPETPEQRARKAEMARRLRETAAAMRTVQ
ncbi:hypothetical protein RWE87_05025 [Sinorhizobium meliloti]|uniref:hypothetical protein n=1 Tax=Rhizobium meliloti TaxID=382 RepID=UPI00299D776E|nr:hypothetical protein [Sinorhizobium meliloti]